MTRSISVPAARPLAQRAVLFSVALGGMLVPLNSTMIAGVTPKAQQEASRG